MSHQQQQAGPPDSFSVGWTPQADTIRPSRRQPPPSSAAATSQQQLHEPTSPLKPAKKQTAPVHRDSGYQIGWTDEPATPSRPCKKLGPPLAESQGPSRWSPRLMSPEMATPKKRPGTGKDASFSVGWTKPDANAKNPHPAGPSGGLSTFSVGWTGVPESFRNSRKPPPSTARNSDTVFQPDDPTSSPPKPFKRLSSRPESEESYSISWSDTPSNQNIRPSRRLGPTSTRESADPSPPSPSKRRVVGGEASFSVGWTMPDQKPPKNHISHRQAPGGNSSLSISWDTPPPPSDNVSMVTLSGDEDLSAPLIVPAGPVPYSIGILAHCPSCEDTNHPVVTLLPILLASLTAAGVSHTNIFLECVPSLSSIAYTALKLTSKVDGIIVFSISLIDPEAPITRDLISPILEALQQITLTNHYPAIIPGFVTCPSTPKSVLEMKGVMKHVTRDWADHLVATLALSRVPEPFLFAAFEEEVDAATDSCSSLIEDDSISELTEVSVSPVEVAGRSSAEQRSRDGDVAGNRKKRGPGGSSSLVLG